MEVYHFSAIEPSILMRTWMVPQICNFNPMSVYFLSLLSFDLNIYIQQNITHKWRGIFSLLTLVVSLFLFDDFCYYLILIAKEEFFWFLIGSESFTISYIYRTQSILIFNP